MFNDIKSALDWLYSQREKEKRKDLSRINNAINLLEIKTNYKIIHVAGTNGKGSTSTYLKNILKNTGNHVGLFTSPYVLIFNDRIMINDRYISNAEIMYYLNKLEFFSYDYYNKYQEKFSFFELTFLMALLFFQDRNIDIAIIECGIGGLLDITNCLDTDLQIITSIGYDHQAVLGYSLKDILSNKLGIVKTKCLTILDKEFDNQIIKYAKETNTYIDNIKDYIEDVKISKNKTTFLYKRKLYSLQTLALYQAYNAALAIEASKELIPTISMDLISYSLIDTTILGRMEVISEKPFIIFDGAHNISAIEELKKSIKYIKGNNKLVVIYSSLKDKEYNKCLSALDQITDEFYFVSFNDLRLAQIDDFITTKPFKVTEIEDIEFDIKNIYLFTGSLHFISYLKNNLKKFKQ